MLTIKTDTAITIKNDDPNTATSDRIVVEKDKNANITLDGVNIEASNNPALEIAGGSRSQGDIGSSGNVNITLAEGSTNILKAGADGAGLQKNGADATGTLTISGSGTLEATGSGSGAGIGGGLTWGTLGSGIRTPNLGTKNITINSGTITAVGGTNGAGIGAGGGLSDDNHQASNITINGGVIKATGYRGAGIGGGYVSSGASGDVKNITIKGGTVTASSTHGAGIGGGQRGTASNVTIDGGTVTASSTDGAGIGGGWGSSASDVIINGGSVKAASQNGHDIGGGEYGGASVTPKNNSGQEVQLLEISNPDSSEVTIDNTKYTPSNHQALDSSDTTLYVYLTKENHTIIVGTTQYDYTYKNGQFVATFAIKYELNDGQNPDDAPATYIYGTTTTLPTNPTKTGYLFTGWTGSNGTTPEINVTIPTNSAGDKAYTANWEPITYRIKYDLDGGTNASGNPNSYTIESSTITLAAPTREGYDFAGWTGTDLTNESESVTITKGSTGDKEYIAHWDIKNYNVMFDVNGGDAISPDYKNVEHNGSYGELPTPSRTGHTFDGWYTELTGGQKVTAESTIMDNDHHILYAHWTPINYRITYDLNGGSLSDSAKNPEQYTAEYNMIILNNPYRDGYTFAGWTGTDLSEATEYVIIHEGSTGNRSYTATWTKNAEPEPTPTPGRRSFSSNRSSRSNRTTNRSATTTTPTEEITFVDVPSTAYYYNAVRWAVEKNITSGTDKTHFSPNDPLTRAQVVTFLWRAAGKPKVTDAPTFPDVAKDSYYTEAVKWAASIRIAVGYADGNFRPGREITREELVAILYRYEDYTKGIDGGDTNIRGYKDASDISEYAIASFRWACGKGIVKGSNGRLMPKEKCTRAQGVSMLYRLLG